jgi:hypothetical protein
LRRGRLGLLLGRGLLRKVLFHQRLNRDHDDKRHQEDEEEAALVAGLVLRILKFGQSLKILFPKGQRLKAHSDCARCGTP